MLKIFSDNKIKIFGTASHGSKIIHSLTKHCLDETMISYRNYMIFNEIYKKLIEMEKSKNPPVNPFMENKELDLPNFSMEEFNLYYVILNIYLFHLNQRVILGLQYFEFLYFLK